MLKLLIITRDSWYHIANFHNKVATGLVGWDWGFTKLAYLLAKATVYLKTSTNKESFISKSEVRETEKSGSSAGHKNESQS